MKIGTNEHTVSITYYNDREYRIQDNKMFHAGFEKQFEFMDKGKLKVVYKRYVKEEEII